MLSTFIIFPTLHLLLHVANCHNVHSLTLEHSFDSGLTWSRRATINVTLEMGIGGQSVHAELADEQSLGLAEKSRILDLAEDNRLYYYRIPASVDGQSEFVVGVTPACDLVLSHLSDIVTLFVNPSPPTPSVLSVNDVSILRSASIADCSNVKAHALSSSDDAILTDFNTTLRIMQPMEGPEPDTKTFLDIQERERKAKEEGQPQENKSFFAKYWMYIVPVVIFLLLSGGSAPEQGGQ